MAVEIERKFLLAPVNIESLLKRESLEFKKILIEQFYIKASKDDTRRYRRVENKFIYTQKSGFGLIREEFEKEVSKDEYLKAKESFKDKIISKFRYFVKLDGVTLEIDEFMGPLSGLTILEVEFRTKASSDEFTFPEIFKPYLITEVTADIKFTNGYLSKTLKVPTIEYDLKRAFGAIKEANHQKASINIKIPPYQSISDSIRLIVYALALSIETNQEAILEKNYDRERLHQFRVANRKLKTLLKIFGSYFKKRWLKKRLKFISKNISKTNQNRDLDIYLESLHSFDNLIDDKELSCLKNHLQLLQSKANKNILKLLNSKKFQKELQKLKNLKGLKSNLDAPTILVVENILRDKYSKVLQTISKLNKNSSNKEFHKLRIELKEFRYLIEFFSNAIRSFDTKEVLRDLKKMQDIFGEFQDLNTQIEYLKSLQSECEVDTMLNRLTHLRANQKEKILKELESFKLF